MKFFFKSLFLTTLAILGMYGLQPQGLAIDAPKKAPSLAESGKHRPEAQKLSSMTTLLADTELESELLASLRRDEAIHEQAEIHSVNCELARCQVLVEARTDAGELKPILVAHLKKHPQFGQGLRLTLVPEQPNPRLLTLFYSQETRGTRTH